MNAETSRPMYEDFLKLLGSLYKPEAIKGKVTSKAKNFASRYLEWDDCRDGTRFFFFWGGKGTTLYIVVALSSRSSL